MLIVALVLAVVGLAALVTAVVTSNELIAWVCIGASVIGVVLLIIDALRERSGRTAESPAEHYEPDAEPIEDYPEEAAVADEPEDLDEPDESALDSDAETAVSEKLEDEDTNR